MDENRGRELRTPELQFENATDPESDIALAASLFNEPGREADVAAAYGAPSIRLSWPCPGRRLRVGVALRRFPDRFDQAEQAFAAPLPQAIGSTRPRRP